MMEIDRFEPVYEVSAELVSCGDGETLHSLSYDVRYLPESGKRYSAQYRISLSVSQESQGTATAISTESSTVELPAKFIDHSEDYLCFFLFEGGEEKVGTGYIDRNQLPEWLTNGTECYVTVQLEYDHEYTKEKKGFSEDRIEDLRKQGERTIDKLKG
jgi:hypothetical protein